MTRDTGYRRVRGYRVVDRQVTLLLECGHEKGGGEAISPSDLGQVWKVHGEWIAFWPRSHAKCRVCKP